MKTYLVGGAVRDKLLGIEPHEFDWVVVGSSVDEMQALGYQQVGNDFPVFLHPQSKEEYALARTERKSGKGYTGFQVSFDQTVTLQQDLLRRDLTINAIAEDEEGNLIDPFNGRDDIANRQLRHVSAAFTEDPLRVLRVARFWARFFHLGFSIAAETQQLLHRMVATGELKHLTPERVWKEWEKSLNTESPAKFLELLTLLGAEQQVLDGLRIDPSTLDNLRTVAQFTTTPELRFASLFLTQPATVQIGPFCRRLAIPNRFKEAAQLASAQRLLITQPTPLTVEQLYQLLTDIDYWRRPQRLTALLTLREAIQQTPQAREKVEYAAQAARQIDAQQLLKEGLRGPEVGRALEEKRRAVFTQQLNT